MNILYQDIILKRWEDNSVGKIVFLMLKCHQNYICTAISLKYNGTQIKF